MRPAGLEDPLCETLFAQWRSQILSHHHHRHHQIRVLVESSLVHRSLSLGAQLLSMVELSRPAIPTAACGLACLPRRSLRPATVVLQWSVPRTMAELSMELRRWSSLPPSLGHPSMRPSACAS